MAVLHYSPSLSLNLWEASEMQRNGESPVLGASVPVTKRLYDTIFYRLHSMEELKGVLRSVTSMRISSVLEELRQDEKLVGLYVPRDPIRVTPCILSLSPPHVLVAIPIFIEGATTSETEEVLRRCITSSAFVCKGNEIHVSIELPHTILYDILP